MTTPDKGLVSDLVVRIHLKLTASSQSKHFAWLEGELAQLVAHERDEAIVGAYRAAAAQVRSFNNAALCDLANEIEALPPQSALDAVERSKKLTEAEIIMRFRKMLDRIGIHGYYSEMQKEFNDE